MIWYDAEPGRATVSGKLSAKLLRLLKFRARIRLVSVKGSPPTSYAVDFSSNAWQSFNLKSQGKAQQQQQQYQ